MFFNLCILGVDEKNCCNFSELQWKVYKMWSHGVQIVLGDYRVLEQHYWQQYYEVKANFLISNCNNVVMENSNQSKYLLEFSVFIVQCWATVRSEKTVEKLTYKAAS